jgi:hypothetical protein
MIVRNDSTTTDLALAAIFMSTNAASVIVTFQRNAVIGTVTASNNASPVNMNFQSGRAADVTAYTWNETASGLGGLTAGSTLNAFIINQGVTIAPVDEGFILAKDDNIVITTESPTETPEFACSIRMHEVDRDYLEDFK